MKIQKLIVPVLLSLLITAQVLSQPANWFGDLSTANNSLFVNATMNDRGVTMSTPALPATITKTNAKFLFNTLPNIYNPKWTGSSTDKVRILNSKLSAAAFYGEDVFWQEDFEIDITDGLYYTFVVGKNSLSNNDMSILETNFNPVSINTVSQNPITTNVFSTDNVVVTANLSQVAHTGEFIFLRYTTDAWNSSSFLPMTSSGSGVYTCTIPAMNQGTHIRYYILSTITNTPSHSDIDYLTLKLNNNSALNYEYMIQGLTNNSGIADRKMIFNEGTNYYNDFSVMHMGSYGNTALLTFKGGQIQTWKSGTHDITGAAMYYRIYLQGMTPPAFDTIVLPWRADLPSFGEQLWENDTLSDLIFYNLANGDYNIDVYYEAFYTIGVDPYIHVDNNGGQFYKLTFDIDNSISYGTHGFVEKSVIVAKPLVESISTVNWHNSNLGLFNLNNVLQLKGGEVETLKTGIHDITGVRMFYRILHTPAMPPYPQFSSIELPWKQDLSYPGHQIWGNDTMLIDVLSGLMSGVYDFQVYFELNYKIGVDPQIYSFIDNNNNSYYVSHFTYNSTVGEIESDLTEQIVIYPNPAQDILFIQLFNGRDVQQISFFDMMGKRVLFQEGPAFKGLLSIDLSTFKSGVYFIEITTTDQVYGKKIIIK
ncbi:MAG: T9SS type A sorting domain-containing protein [Bacteroidales bacterium]|nr:T9SS type A sorting domain-containing protein [Bacteroidales bacterium]